MLPGFDINDFPFILCAGMKCISLLNVKEGTSNPLIYDITNPGFQGISNCFAKQEDYGLSIHWTTSVLNTDGRSENLIQYSYIALKKDAI